MIGSIEITPLRLIVSIISCSVLVFVVMQFSVDNHLELSAEIKPQQTQTTFDKTRPIKSQSATELGVSTEELTLPIDISLSNSIRPAAHSDSDNSFLALDDESLLIISDRLENIVAPAFLRDNEEVDSRTNKNTALDIFVTSLPEGLSSTDFQEINTLLRDYLPYEIADNLALQAEEQYLVHQQEQEYLSSVLSNGRAPESMDEQIAIAKQLTILKGELADSEVDVEPSDALLAWQKTQHKLEETQSTSSNPEQDRHNRLSEEYGEKVANDYFELAAIEAQWTDKYKAYLVERNIISEAALSDDDKQEQIESLIKQHYDENEWAAVRGYDQIINQLPVNEG